jgi:hypothetical protein
MYFLYNNGYRIFKPLEISTRRESKAERRKMEGMNQLGI